MRMVRTTTGLAMAVSLVTLAFLVASALVRAETAEGSFAKAEKLLAKGELSAALASYAVAARADRNNVEYMQHYAMVRRAVDLRNRLDSEKDPERWEYMAKGLRAFYASELVYPELVKLDEAIHARLGSADSAAMLGETQFSLDRNAAAVKTLSLSPDKATAKTQALLGIALARDGKAEAAKQIAGKLSLPDNPGPTTAYAAARLHAATGDRAKAVGLLTSCFESVAPSQLEGFRSHARQCPEFAAMASDPGFQRALETQSKVPESKCSGGSSCAGCPMSGKCATSQGKSQ